MSFPPQRLALSTNAATLIAILILTDKLPCPSLGWILNICVEGTCLVLQLVAWRLFALSETVSQSQ